MATSITLTTNSASTEYTLATGGRGPAGAGGTTDATIIDGSTNAVAGNAVFDALALKAPLESTIITDADNRTLALSDTGAYIRFTNVGTVTITVPTNATVSFPVGTQVHFRRDAAAGVLALSNAGVTINNSTGIGLVAPGGNASLVKTATDTWDLIGRTALELTTALKGAVADATRIGAEYMPETLVVDWIETADAAAMTIPTASYGQKAGIPYFGNSPLRDQVLATSAFSGQLLIDGSATPTVAALYSTPIGSIQVPTADAVDGAKFAFEFEIDFDDTGLGVPNSTTQKFYLFARLGAATPVMAQGSTMQLIPEVSLTRYGIKGSAIIEASAGNIRVILNTESCDKVYAADAVTAPTFRPFAPAETNTTANYPVASGTSTSINFYLVCNDTVAGGTAFILLTFKGLLDVYKPVYFPAADLV